MSRHVLWTKMNKKERQEQGKYLCLLSTRGPCCVMRMAIYRFKIAKFRKIRIWNLNSTLGFFQDLIFILVVRAALRAITQATAIPLYAVGALQPRMIESTIAGTRFLVPISIFYLVSSFSSSASDTHQCKNGHSWIIRGNWW